MGTGTISFLAAAAVIAAYAIIVYNQLVALKHNVGKAWSNIDVLLKQRHEEIPKLVETCRQYMRYEQESLQKVMLARNAVSDAQRAGDMRALGSAENGLRMGLANLFAVAEAYPELKASEKFRHLQVRITGLENSIADRREFYNESVNISNIRIEQFPDLIIARHLSFPSHELLQFDDTEKADVKMRTLFEG